MATPLLRAPKMCIRDRFGGETPEPETVRGLLLDEIARLKREGVDEELFTLCKNQLYGELVQDLENIEDVAGALASSFFRGRTPADEIETLASVTLSDVNGALRAMLCTERSEMCIRDRVGERRASGLCGRCV